MDKRKTISPALRFTVFQRDGFACKYCGRKSPEVELEVDHIVPIALGGTNNLDNLVTACKDCNRGKAATDINQYDYEGYRGSNAGRKSKEKLKQRYSISLSEERHDLGVKVAKMYDMDFSPFIAKLIKERYELLKEEGAITEDD